MKANEFVKEFGIEKAKLLLSTQGKTIAELKGEYTAKQLKECQGYIVSGDLMSFVDLKRLVESHEFVSANGGVEVAMKYINNHDPNATSKHYNALRTKVSDVESCL